MQGYRTTAETAMELSRDAIRHPGLFEGRELRRALAVSAQQLAHQGASPHVVSALAQELRALPASASAQDVAQTALAHLQRLL